MERINLGFTAKIEDRILGFAVARLPAWVRPDYLTFLALLSALAGGILYDFVDEQPVFLWLINFCLLIHWLADGLDGRLARFRNQTRPNYGYYVDHVLDSFSAALILGGINASNMTETSAWVWVLSLMLLSMVHVFLKTKVSGRFELSMQQFGATEARLALLFLNCFIFFSGNPEFFWGNSYLRLMDLFGWAGVIFFTIILVPQVVRTALELDRGDRGKQDNH